MGCFVCGNFNTEKHHIIKRSQSQALIKCELNLVELCPAHHRGHNGVHGRNGRALDIMLREYLYKKLDLIFINEYITEEEIRDKLNITESSVKRLVKILTRHKNGYLKEDLLRSCFGGRYW